MGLIVAASAQLEAARKVSTRRREFLFSEFLVLDTLKPGQLTYP
jgi:hypothetical protein